MTRPGFAALALAITTLTGCPAPADAPPSDGTSLAATAWRLVTLGDAELPAGEYASPATLTFVSDSSVAGSTGCNRYFGSVLLGPGDSVAFGTLGSTMMACPPDLMTQETQFLSALGDASSASLRGDSLVLRGPSGAALTFVAVPLDTTDLR